MYTYLPQNQQHLESEVVRTYQEQKPFLKAITLTNSKILPTGVTSLNGDAKTNVFQRGWGIKLMLLN